MTDTLSIKNPQTSKQEKIQMQHITFLDWGFSFRVSTETEAYKAAYQYRKNPHGVRVEYAHGAQSWQVTVFNEEAAAGIDK